jgi:hypothetical protein
MTETFTPSHIATLATRAAIDDLRILLKSLEFWNTPKPPTVHLFCDAAVSSILPSFNYKGAVVVKECLNEYTQLNRAAMERIPGKKYKNLFFDFVCEKLTLLDWVFETTPDVSGVLFCDADICFLAPLFSIPTGTELAVSPHMIREMDELRYGIYNAGMIWVKSPAIVSIWREECATSKFYEQLPIEFMVERVTNVYQIPVTENYGWWRLWQGRRPAAELQARWGMNRTIGGSGITVGGAALGSVHTHFGETRDAATVEYNRWVIDFLKRIAKAHEPTRRFITHLGFR